MLCLASGLYKSNSLKYDLNILIKNIKGHAHDSRGRCEGRSHPVATRRCSRRMWAISATCFLSVRLSVCRCIQMRGGVVRTECSNKECPLVRKRVRTVRQVFSYERQVAFVCVNKVASCSAASRSSLRSAGTGLDLARWVFCLLKPGSGFSFDLAHLFLCLFAPVAP